MTHPASRGGGGIDPNMGKKGIPGMLTIGVKDEKGGTTGVIFWRPERPLVQVLGSMFAVLLVCTCVMPMHGHSM